MFRTFISFDQIIMTLKILAISQFEKMHCDTGQQIKLVLPLILFHHAIHIDYPS